MTIGAKDQNGNTVCLSCSGDWVEAMMPIKFADIVAFNMGEKKIGAPLGSDAYFEAFEARLRKLDLAPDKVLEMVERERKLVARGKRAEEWDGTLAARVAEFKKQQRAKHEVS